MANNRVVLEIVTKGGKQVLQLAESTEQLSNKVEKTSSAYDRASKASGRFNYTQNAGVRQQARNARDFSKLSQTIGSGNNGLVGAYATLAANTFAVVAAFEALKRSTNALKVTEGLNAQGARLGKTLSIAADNIREVTDATISMADSMRMTAQLTAGGFNSSQIEKLAVVAKDAAGALGRDLNDATDRLTRGVTKLEPELLDEIGIMTKLDEASRKYATSVNKSAQSLTAAEKRQAYFNAVIDEGTRKFGGIGDKVDEYNAYTRLAASATDLFNSSVGSLAMALAPIAEFFADNKLFLVGSVALYAATIKDDLIPALSKAAEKQAKIIEESQKFKVAKYDKLADNLADLEGSYTTDSNNKLRNAAGRFTTDVGADALSSLVDKYKKDTITVEDFKKSHQRLNEALEDTESRLQNVKTSSIAYADLQENIKIIKKNRDAVNDLNKSLYEQKAAYNALGALEVAQNTRLSNIFSSTKAIGSDLKEQFFNLQNSSALEVQGMEGFAQKYKKATTTIGNAARVAGTGMKAFGTITLNLLPIIGQITFALGILSAAYKFLKDVLTTAEQKEYNKTLEEFNTILSSSADKMSQYNRLTREAEASFQAQTDALILTGNAVSEITSKFEELEKAQKRAASSSVINKLKNALSVNTNSSGSSSIDNALFDSANGLSPERAKDYFRGDYQKGLNALSAAYGVVNDSMKIYIDREVEKINKLKTSDERIKATSALVKDVGKKYDSLALTVENVNEAYKNLESATTSFIQSATIGTPIDGLRENLSKTTTAIAEFSIQARKGGVDSEQLGKTLASIGSQSRNLLGDSLPELLRLEEVNNEITRLKSLGADRTKEENKLLTFLLRESTIRARQIGPQIQRNLDAQEAQVRQYQKSLRLLDAQLSIEKARYEKVKDLFEVGAAGYLAREEHLERVRAAEVAELDMQQAILKSMQLQAQITLDSLTDKKTNLELSIQELETQKQITKETRLQFLTRQSREFLQSFGVLKEVTEKTTETSRLDELKSQVDQISVSINSAKDNMQNLGDAIENLDNQRGAILMQNLSEAEKMARAMGEEFKVSSEFYKQVIEYAEILVETNRDIERYNRLVSGHTTEIAENIEKALSDYEKTRKSLIDELALKAGQLKIDLSIIEAQMKGNNLRGIEEKAAKKTYNTAVAIYENELLKTESLLKQEDVKLRLKILEEAIFDATEEGLKWQQDSLNYYEKQASLQADIVSKQQELNRERRETSRIASGLPETDRSKNNEAILAAAEQLQAAKTAATIRLSSINAEYALLSAQKTALEQELIARHQVLKAMGASEAYLAPLENAVATLRNINVGELRDMAVNGIRLEIALAEQALKKAVTIADQRFQYGEGMLARVLQERRDNQTRADLEPTIANAYAKAVEEPLRVALGSKNTGIEDLKQEVAKPLTPIVSIRDDISAIRSIMENGGSAFSGTSIADAGNYAKSMGFRVSGGDGFGGRELGGHSKDSKHYSGQALDINIGTGNVEANIPDMRAKMDRLAIEYQKKGFVVLWNGERYLPDGSRVPLRGNPHRNHIHVEQSSVKYNQRTSVESSQSEALASMGRGSTSAQVGQIASSLSSSLQNSATEFEPLVKSLINSEELAVLEKLPDIIEVIGNKPLPDLGFIKARDDIVAFLEKFSIVSSNLTSMAQQMGPEGEMVIAISSGVDRIGSSLAQTMDLFSQTSATATEKFIAISSVASNALSTIGQITSAASQQRVRGIEAEIAAERARDGQSEASQKKIASLEKQKEKVKKREFETNKKLMMAQAVIATATGIAQALSYGFPMGPILAGVIGAMGAAQLAIIAGTTYSGSSSSEAGKISKPQKLTIGRVGNQINLDKSNKNAGGEVGYLRGTPGYGRSSSNYSTIGSAYGGMTNRGYGHRSFLVGEKGPEEISTSEPMQINPKIDESEATNNYYNISLLDASGVEELLEKHADASGKGLQKIANSSGQRFMESVDFDSHRARKR